MSNPIQYSAGATLSGIPLMVRLVLTSDNITSATGKSPTVTISKNGGSFASPAGAVSEVGNGWYAVADNVADRNTLGPLKVHATAADCNPGVAEYEVARTPGQSVWGENVSDMSINYSDETAGQAFRNAFNWNKNPDGPSGVRIAPTGLVGALVESDVDARAALAYCLAFAAGQLSGAGSGTTTIKNPSGTATRIVATTPGTGNRTSITLTSP